MAIMDFILKHFAITPSRMPEPKTDLINPVLHINDKSIEKSPIYLDSMWDPYNPARLYTKRSSYELFDDCLADDVVDSLMEFKKNMIIGSGIFIDSQKEEVKEFWEQNLFRDYEGIFVQDIKKMLSSMAYGFSFTEPIFKSIKVKSKTYWGLKCLKVRPQHTVTIHTDDLGNVEKITQLTKAEELTLNPKDFLIYSHRPQFSNPYGQADITEGVYSSVFAKRIVRKFMNIALERFAAPFVKGKLPPTGASPTDRATMEEIIKNFSIKSGAILPDGHDIDFLEGRSNITVAYIDAINYYNLQIARALLISDLMGLSGKQMSSGGLGGNLGGVQFIVMLQNFKNIREEFLSLINNKIILPITKANFGDNVYAEMKFYELTTDEKYKAAEMFLKYINAGRSTSHEQDTWFFDILGAPIGEQEQTQEDKKDMPKEPSETTPPKPEDNPEVEPDPDVEPEPEDMPEKPNPDEAQKHSLIFQDDAKGKNVPNSNCGNVMSGEFKIWRELTKSEQKVDFAEIDKKFFEWNDKYSKDFQEAVKTIVNNFYEYLRTKKIIENKKYKIIRDMKLKGLVDLRGVIKAMLDDVFEQGIKQAKSEESKLNLAMEDPAASLAAKEIVSQWKQSRIWHLTKHVSDKILDKARPIMEDAMLKGWGVRETIKSIDETLEADLGKAKLDMMVRTNIMSTFNQGRLQTLKQTPDLQGLEWSAILDGATCETCLAFDKKIVRPSQTNDLPMPAHPRCRCIWVSVHSEDIEGKTEKEVYEPIPPIEVKGGFMKTLK